MKGDDLSAAVIQPALTTGWLGRPYHYETEIQSTNDQLKAWVEGGSVVDPVAGTVLLTDHQTAGRGRLSRRWDAPPRSSLLFSALFRPGWPSRQAGWMTMIAGLALAEAIEATSGIFVGLKWPNDLMAMHEGQWRKLGGLLLDAQIIDDTLVWAILGAGININIEAGELPDAATPATSLRLLVGHTVPRRPLLLDCLLHLERRYEAAERGRSPWPEWNDRLITLGQPVTVSGGQGSAVVEGMSVGTDEWGRLLVRDESGKLQTVAAGDVTLRIPSVPRDDND